MTPTDPKTPLTPEQGPAETTDDFENCKGQCGYTIWCRACMASRDQEAPQQEPDNGLE